MSQLEVPGPLLGLLEDAEFGAVTFSLSPGDKILFYTDGIIEERGEDSEMFGVEYLEEVFEKAVVEKIDPVIDYLILELNSYINKNTYDDDITLLLYEFDEPEV